MEKPSVYLDTNIFSAYWYDGAGVSALTRRLLRESGRKWNGNTHSVRIEHFEIDGGAVLQFWLRRIVRDSEVPKLRGPD